MKKVIAALALVFVSSTSFAAGIEWKEWSFLLGNWRGASDGIPGAAQTLFSFDMDQSHRVIVRHDHSDYVKYRGVPSFAFDGQMFIFKNAAGDTQALSTGDDGRTLTFIGTVSADGNSWTFESAPENKYPQFRLTYKKIDENNLVLWYDYALPGQPGNFQPYLHGTGVRLN